MSPASSSLWSSLILLRYVQFPFRFLTIITVTTTIGYGLIIQHHAKSPIKTFLLASLIIISFFVNPKFYKSLGYQYGERYVAEGKCMTTAWADEHLPIWVKKCLTKPYAPIVKPTSDNIEVISINITQGGRSLDITTRGQGEIIVGKYYFPTWEATDHANNIVPLEPFSDNGLIKLSITQDNSQVKLKLKQSKIDYLGNLITLLSLVICFCLLIVTNKSDKITLK